MALCVEAAQSLDYTIKIGSKTLKNVKAILNHVGGETLNRSLVVRPVSFSPSPFLPCSLSLSLSLSLSSPCILLH